MCSIGGWIPFGPVYLLLCACLVGQRVRLCSPMDCGPPGCSAHGILQARLLEWVAVSFSSLSCIAGGFLTC